MKAIFGLFSLAGLVLSWIIGYALMQKVLPEYMPMWYISQVFLCLGLIGQAMSDS